MMHGQEKSDPVVVAKKPLNEAGQPGAEASEPRAGAKGNAVRPTRAGYRTGEACHTAWTA